MKGSVLQNITDTQEEKLSDAINDIAKWLCKQDEFKKYPKSKIYDLLEDSLYSETVVDAIQKDLGTQL